MSENNNKLNINTEDFKEEVVEENEVQQKEEVKNEEQNKEIREEVNSDVEALKKELESLRAENENLRFKPEKVEVKEPEYVYDKFVKHCEDNGIELDEGTAKILKERDEYAKKIYELEVKEAEKKSDPNYIKQELQNKAIKEFEKNQKEWYSEFQEIYEDEIKELLDLPKKNQKEIENEITNSVIQDLISSYSKNKKIGNPLVRAGKILKNSLKNKKVSKNVNKQKNLANLGGSSNGVSDSQASIPKQFMNTKNKDLQNSVTKLKHLFDSELEF